MYVLFDSFNVIKMSVKHPLIVVMLFIIGLIHLIQGVKITDNQSLESVVRSLISESVEMKEMKLSLWILNDQNTDLRRQLTIMKTENGNLKQRIGKLEVDTDKVRAEMEKLRDRFTENRPNNEGNSNEFSEENDSNYMVGVKMIGDEGTEANTTNNSQYEEKRFMEHANVFKRTIEGETISRGISTRIAQTEVAFHVYLSGNRCYKNQDTFMFDIKEVDLAGGYNIQTGIYDAPVSGLYAFTWTVGSGRDSAYTAELVVNGLVKGLVHTDDDAQSFSPATGFVLTHVYAGDDVFIRFNQGANCHVNSDVWSRTTFSGWLML